MTKGENRPRTNPEKQQSKKPRTLREIPAHELENVYGGQEMKQKTVQGTEV